MSRAYFKEVTHIQPRMQEVESLHSISKGNKKLSTPKLNKNDLQLSQKLGHSSIYIPETVKWMNSKKQN